MSARLLSGVSIEMLLIISGGRNEGDTCRIEKCNSPCNSYCNDKAGGVLNSKTGQLLYKWVKSSTGNAKEECNKMGAFS